MARLFSIFVLLNAFIIFIANVRYTLRDSFNSLYVRIFLDETAKVDALRKVIAQPDYIADIEYVSKERALIEFAKRFPHAAKSLKLLEENPLPASFRVYFRHGYRNPVIFKEFAELAETLPGVINVYYNKRFLEDLWNNYSALFYFSIIIGLAIFVLVFSSVKDYVHGEFLPRCEEFLTARHIAILPSKVYAKFISGVIVKILAAFGFVFFIIGILFKIFLTNLFQEFSIPYKGIMFVGGALIIITLAVGYIELKRL